MGTRATIHIKTNKDDKNSILSIYKQFDGAEELQENLTNFLRGKSLCDGYGEDLDYLTLFNGLDDLAFRLVAYLKNLQIKNKEEHNKQRAARDKSDFMYEERHNFKDSIGGLYITNDLEEEGYNYIIFVKNDKIVLSCNDDLIEIV